MPTQTQQMSIEELSTLYDRIYDIADRLIKKYNPCNIHTENGRVVCRYGHNHYHQEMLTISLCCGICKHHSTKGCTTKCLGCKLFLCQAVCNNDKTKKVFGRLLTFGYEHGLPTGVYFKSKKKWLKGLQNEML